MITRRNFLKKTIITSALSSLYLNNFSLLNAKNNNKRIKTPLLKMPNGTFKEISWSESFAIIKEKSHQALKSNGVNGVGLYTQANISIEESYALNKLFKGGFRSNNILTTSYKNDDIAAKARTLVYGIDGSSGTYDDLNKTNLLLSFDINLDDVDIDIRKKINNNKNLKFININTANNINKNAYLNINIKPFTYHILLNYIMRNFLYKNKYKIDLEYIKKHTVFANYKNDEQWEISYKNYIKSFDKYNIYYLTNKIKSNKNESDREFRSKLAKLSHMVISDVYKTFSLTSNKFNESNYAFKTNLLLQSMHVILNKHSRPGCGVFNINDSNAYAFSVDYIGLNSNRLPTNMYIKYKEHRLKTEKIWNLPPNTLNPVSNNTLLENIQNSTTKFLWITGFVENNSKNNIKSKIFDMNKPDDLFIVTSETYINDTSYNSNLILPTTLENEKIHSFGTFDRKISFNYQKKIPYASSMSLLWQIIEFSKKYNIEEVYKRVKVDNTQALKNIIKPLKAMNYTKTSTLYDILFMNNNTKLFQSYNNLNTEKNGDNRKIFGTDDGIFNGFRYFLHEYLFEELRNFGINNAHDIRPYKEYQYQTFIWPTINNKQIKYRFNPIDDLYARESSTYDMKFSFYGKMKSKNLPYGNLSKITSENKKSLKYRAKIFTTTFD